MVANPFSLPSQLPPNPFGPSSPMSLNPAIYPPLTGVALATEIPGGKASGRPSRSRWMSVSACSFLTCLWLDVLPCVWCCTVFRFLSASLPNPVNGSSSSAPGGTSTLAPGCAPSSMSPLNNSRPQMGQRLRRARLEEAHNPISPIESTGSLPPRSTVPDEESPGSHDRKTVRQRPERSSGFLFKKRDIMRELQRADPY